MSSAARLDKQSFISLQRLSASVQHDISIRRAETEERVAQARSRNLEWELGLAANNNAPKARAPRANRTNPEATPKKKSKRSRLTSDLSVPAVVYRQRRSTEGLRSFHYSVEPIPKSSFFRELASGTKIGPGAGEARVRYTTGIEGEHGYLLGDRVQSDLLGRPLIISNISRRAFEIASFFSLVEENERNAKLDKARINLECHPEIWRRIVDDPACEPSLLQAYRSVKGQGTIEVELSRGADALVKLLARHGFAPADKAYSPERREELDGIKWTKGRGGRIQWRIVIALPAEFSPRQRRRAVEAICRRLGQRGAMYAAVIHEPVATNHQRNYHAHIDFYDRPCRRLTGDERDLAHVSPKWRAKIKDELAAGALQHLKGQWDFAAAREYRSSSGNRITHKPFRAKKSAAFRAYSFPRQHRAEIARIINGFALMSGLGRLYDPGTYEKMGIPKEPDEQLGPKRNGLEAKGAPTDVGMRNEARHADADRKLIEAAYRARIGEITHEQRAFDQRLRGLANASAEQKAAREDAYAALADQKMIARARLLAELAKLEMRRQLSRAVTMMRAAARAKRVGDDPRGELAARGREARSYLQDWKDSNKDSVVELRQLLGFVARESEIRQAAERLQSKALRFAELTHTKVGLAQRMQAGARPPASGAMMTVEPPATESANLPLLLGRRMQRLLAAAHQSGGIGVAAPRRNVMIRAAEGSDTVARPDTGRPDALRPPASTLDVPTSAHPPGVVGGTQHSPLPVNPSAGQAERNNLSEVQIKLKKMDEEAQVDGGTQDLSRPPFLSPQKGPKILEASESSSGVASIPGSSAARPLEPSFAEQERSDETREKAQQARPFASPATRAGLGGGANTPPVAMVLSAPAAPLTQSEESRRRQSVERSHQGHVEAYFDELDARRVLLQKSRQTGELTASVSAGTELSRRDELMIRWGGWHAEQLARRQGKEIWQVQDYIYRHGEALARSGKEPGPRCQRLLKKWEGQPRLENILRWFVEEQAEAAKRQKITRNAHERARASFDHSRSQ